LVVKDGRRYWGTTDLTRTAREVKARYSNRQQIEETFRLLKQEFGWGSCSCQKQQVQWAHLHLEPIRITRVCYAAPYEIHKKETAAGSGEQRNGRIAGV